MFNRFLSLHFLNHCDSEYHLDGILTLYSKGIFINLLLKKKK